ncbi:MAG: hypothetical protein AB7P14_03275 [Blastocatellales bacterium]
MTPKVSRTRTSQQLAPISSLDKLLVFPVPAADQIKRTLWMDFQNDLTFLLPAFGIVLGLMLLFGQSPFLGAGMVTLCPIILALRIHTAFQARRERQRVNALLRWYRQSRLESSEMRRRMEEEMPDVMYCPVPPVK